MHGYKITNVYRSGEKQIRRNGCIKTQDSELIIINERNEEDYSDIDQAADSSKLGGRESNSLDSPSQPQTSAIARVSF